MAGKGTLPPLPPSDQDSMQANRYDGFYKVTPRSFWGDNEINRIPDVPFKKCKHKFISEEGGVRCSKCNFGLRGSIEARNGKLFYNNQPLGL
jgi:hypothetical protein